MIYLERWIKEKTGGDIKQYQISSLKKILRYASERSDFYRNLAAYEVRNLDDLSKIPFTYPEDLKNEPYKFLCVSVTKIRRRFTLYTSGTTGTPKMVFFTQGDIDKITDYMGVTSKTMADCASLPEGYKVVQLLPDSKPMSQARLSTEGAEKVKAVAVTVQPTLDSENILELIREHKPDVLFGTPTRIYRITQQCEEQHKLDKLGIKVLFISSEYAPRVMDERLEALWGCQVYHYYGMTETGFMGGVDCPSHDKLHFNEYDLLLEVIDPQTGKPVKKGEGELVFTTLRREAMPLIRYRTGDLVELIPGKCSCGTSLISLGRAIKRAESVEKLEDEEVSLTDFDKVMYTVPQVIDYQVAFGKEGEKDTVIVTVEVTKSGGDIKGLVKDAVMSISTIKKHVEAGHMSEPEIKVVDSIKREGRAKKRIQRF